jgi:phosphonate transport system ATP-binding protein
MAAGRVVFEGRALDLTEDVARELYGLEAGEVIDANTATPVAKVPEPYVIPAAKIAASAAFR